MGEWRYVLTGLKRMLTGYPHSSILLCIGWLFCHIAHSFRYLMTLHRGRELFSDEIIP